MEEGLDTCVKKGELSGDMPTGPGGSYIGASRGAPYRISEST